LFSHILVPLDGSEVAERALPHVVVMARVFDAEVSLLHVMEPPADSGFEQFLDILSWHIRESEAESYINQQADRLRDEAQIDARVHLLQGKAAERILDHAHSHNVDLILIGSHGKTAKEEWNLSSVVKKVVARAYTSIMLIPTREAEEVGLTDLDYRRILVPLDCSPRAERVLPEATHLAGQLNADLLFAHVVKEPEMPYATMPAEEDRQLIERIEERKHEQADRYLSTLPLRIDAAAQTQLVTSTKVERGLHAMVQEQDVDLMVLNAHGRSGSTRWPYGSTTAHFIEHSSIPLLVIQDLTIEAMQLTEAERAAQSQGKRRPLPHSPGLL